MGCSGHARSPLSFLFFVLLCRIGNKITLNVSINYACLLNNVFSSIFLSHKIGFPIYLGYIFLHFRSS